MQKRDFNLFLLVICLFALPLYAAGAVLEALLEGGHETIPAFRPSRRSYTPRSSDLVCPYCGSCLLSKKI
jgi:hypothetical protein